MEPFANLLGKTDINIITKLTKEIHKYIFGMLESLNILVLQMHA